MIHSEPVSARGIGLGVRLGEHVATVQPIGVCPMTPHETALVTILLERLNNIDSAPKDPEADTLIRQISRTLPIISCRPC